ncbi:MAG: hypothetical protein NTV00_09545, partial [Methylococcales bacterium]|nr:hypothetical protein [Methylococcales bacterium]
MRKIKKVTKLITHMVMLIPLSSTSWSQPAISDDYSAATNTIGKVAVGSYATGAIELPNDVDWFRVLLEANVRYKIKITSTDLTMVNVSLVMFDDKGGVHVEASNSAAMPPLADGGAYPKGAMTGLDSDFSYMATDTSPYYVMASAGDNSVGHYIVTVELDQYVPWSTAYPNYPPSGGSVGG